MSHVYGVSIMQCNSISYRDGNAIIDEEASRLQGKCMQKTCFKLYTGQTLPGECITSVSQCIRVFDNVLELACSDAWLRQLSVSAGPTVPTWHYSLLRVTTERLGRLLKILKEHLRAASLTVGTFFGS